MFNGIKHAKEWISDFEREQKAMKSHTTSPTEQEIVARAIKALVPMGYGMTMGEAIDYAKTAISALDSHRAKNAGEVEQMLRFIDADVYEHEPHTVLPWLDKAATLITSLRSIIEEKDEALDRIAKDLPQRGPQGFEDFSTAYSRIKHIARSRISDGVK